MTVNVYGRREEDMKIAFRNKDDKGGYWCYDYNDTRKNTKHSKARKEQQVVLYTSLRLRRKMNGLNQNNGFVLKRTKLLLHHWPGNFELSTHPMFDALPKHTLFTFDPTLLGSPIKFNS